MKRWIAAVVFLFIHIWVLGKLETLGEYEDFLSLSYAESGITESAFTQWKKSDGSEMFREAVIWKAQGKQEVLAENMGRSRQIPCYQMKGQPGALFGKDLAEGRYFTEGEQDVCLLDQETARQLYGSDHVQGLEIRLDGEAWKIVGILQETSPVCVTSAEQGIQYDGIAVRKNEAGSSSNLAENQIRTVLGSTDGQYIDGKWYVVSARIFYAFVWSIGVLLLGCLLSTSVLPPGRPSNSGKIIRSCIFGGSLLAAAGILTWGIVTANPGSDYLPSYWSDFTFFGQLFQEKAEQVKALAAHQEFPAGQTMLSSWRAVTGTGIFLGVGIGICGIGNILKSFAVYNRKIH